MTTTARTTATLIVMRSSSKCGECGGYADPDETHHYTAPGGGYSKAGCDALFATITTDAAPLDDWWRSVLRSMRPDLPVVEYGV